MNDSKLIRTLVFILCDFVFFKSGGTVMRSLICRSALVICLLAVGAQARAEVVLLSQSRSVYASGAVLWASSDSLLAPDFGPFEADIRAVGVGTLGGFAEGSATQVSEIHTGRFSIHGRASAAAQNGGWSNVEYAQSTGRSSFEVLFEVSQPVLFSLAGVLAHSGTCLQLDRDGASFLFFHPDGKNEIAVSEVGILPSGAYTLIVNASASAQEYGGQDGSFDIDLFLEVPVAIDQINWGQLKALFR